MSIDPERWPALHPFLFGLFPVLFFFSQNVGLLVYGDMLFSASASLALAGTGVLLGRGVYGSWRKGAIFSSLGVILFFSYGHIWNLISEATLLGIKTRHDYLLPLWVGFFAVGVFILFRTRRKLRGTTGFLNVAAIAMVAMPLIQIGIHEATALQSENVGQWEGDLEEDLLQPATDSLPNIYYIVPDAYVSSKSLSKIYGYENDSFVSYLEESGFYIAEESIANYPRTRLSLPSSLNFDYLDKIGIDTYDISKESIKNSRILNALKSMGYETVHLGSGFRLTNRNRYADRNIGCESYLHSEFLKEFTNTTIMMPFLSKVDFFGRGWAECSKKVLDHLENLEAEEPHFVFAHFVSPHGPHKYTIEDAIRGTNDSKGKESSYVDEVEYVNERLKEIIKNIKNKNENKNVIIIQADHGNNKTFEGPREEWPPHSPSDTLLKEVTGIFNAYHLPGECKDHLYDTITPVNSFRVVLNCYFDADLKLLPDRAFYLSWDQKSKFNYETYRSQEVTDSARWEPAEQDSTLRKASN